ncbi:hypothetical protein FGO68_gene10663 [Halteria grandinella]|uniref:Uncharacterized protein n=1 Tax=Halteria grandinella TaxID=5974 RepID=A0A8J8P3Q5_HALGN|nr:hypothetical protein FGO68_gene10663 [Halteria grandinella]
MQLQFNETQQVAKKQMHNKSMQRKHSEKGRQHTIKDIQLMDQSKICQSQQMRINLMRKASECLSEPPLQPLLIPNGFTEAYQNSKSALDFLYPQRYNPLQGSSQLNSFDGQYPQWDGPVGSYNALGKDDGTTARDIKLPGIKSLQNLIEENKQLAIQKFLLGDYQSTLIQNQMMFTSNLGFINQCQNQPKLNKQFQGSQSMDQNAILAENYMSDQSLLSQGSAFPNLFMREKNPNLF